MPGTPIFHDADARGDRRLHWIFAIGIYAGVFSLWQAERETRVFRDGFTEARAVFDQQWAERQGR